MDQSRRIAMTEMFTFRKRQKTILILRERERKEQKMETAQHIYKQLPNEYAVYGSDENIFTHAELLTYPLGRTSTRITDTQYFRSGFLVSCR